MIPTNPTASIAIVFSDMLWLATSPSSQGSEKLPEVAKTLAPFVRDVLEWFRSQYEIALRISTVLVALGVILEGPEIAHELREKLGPFRFNHPSMPKWMIRLGFAGWLMIVIGVSGELLFESMVSTKNEQLEGVSSALLGDAEFSAAEANESAAQLEKFSKQLERETEDAKAGTERATERAADASRDADRERIERLNLEKQIAPRRIDQSQRNALWLTCRSSSPFRRVAVVTYALDTEAIVLALQIVRALNCDRKDFVVDNRAASVMPLGGGLTLGIEITGSDAALVDSLKNDLSSFQLVPEKEAKPFPSSEGLSATILIGTKPPPPWE